MEVKKISNYSYAAHLDDGRVFALSTRGDDSHLAGLVWQNVLNDWETMPYSVLGENVVPFGHDNLLPNRLRDILDENNLAPGVLDRQLGLIYGQGIHLYRLNYADGEIVREWVQDREVENWLHSWDVVSYAKGALSDYLHLKGFFNACYLERGSRIGLLEFGSLHSAFHATAQQYRHRQCRGCPRDAQLGRQRERKLAAVIP